MRCRTIIQPFCSILLYTLQGLVNAASAQKNNECCVRDGGRKAHEEDTVRLPRSPFLQRKVRIVMTVSHSFLRGRKQLNILENVARRGAGEGELSPKPPLYRFHHK